MTSSLAYCGQHSLLENTTTYGYQSELTLSQEPIGQKSTKQCRYCKAHKPLSEFHRNSQYKDGHDHRCKACCSTHRAQEREARKNAPPMPSCCDHCGATGLKLQPDHEHGTSRFRGWICKPCNTRLGWLETNWRSIFNYLSTQQ